IRELRQDVFLPSEEGITRVGNIPDTWEISWRGTHSKALNILKHLSDTLGNISEGCIAVAPLCNRQSITRKRLKLPEWSTLPIYRAKQNRNDVGFSSIISHHRPLHLYTIAIIRCNKIRANK